MRILTEHKAKLNHVSNYLIENETIEEGQVSDIFGDLQTAPAAD